MEVRDYYYDVKILYNFFEHLNIVKSFSPDIVSKSYDFFESLVLACLFRWRDKTDIVMSTGVA